MKKIVKNYRFKFVVILVLCGIINLFAQNSITINAGNYYYSPSDTIVNQDDNVTWLNDGGYHNVNFDENTLTGDPFEGYLGAGNPESFISSPTSGNFIYFHEFSLPGYYEYDCSVGSHAQNGMTGVIRVNPSFFTGLVLEQLDNGGEVSGTTYRLYAQMTEGLLYIITGDELNPSSIATTTTFYNDPDGGTFQADINSNYFPDNCGNICLASLEWDTWLTIGDSYNEAPSTTGLSGLNLTNGFPDTDWNFGGTVNSDANILRTTDNPLCLPDGNGRVLLGQFTTDGDLSGNLNFRIQDDNGENFT